MTLDERARLWNEAVRFHGHRCPGLAIGVRMALDYKERIGLRERAGDEEIVAVTETDSCSVDGIQSVLGCTAGKGNLRICRRGKHVFTFFQRSGGEGLRYSWKSAGLEGMSREEKTEYFLNAPNEVLYNVEPARCSLPLKAAIYASVPCALCRELTAEPQLRVREGQPVCRECAGEAL
ncbi:MAG: FmdE family protein [Proteobacteria bacterium]|nr:FmdE family protein [Pseudomonadota bacterium]MCL2307162.1 FmdE family protein [Pseudomonadota bacterium]